MHDRPRMRPRFEVELDVPVETVFAELARQLARPGAAASGAVLAHHVELRVAKDRAHFWSPNLSLEIVDDTDPAMKRLRGRFGPDQSVWMLFILIYAILGMVGVLALMFGTSQWIIHESPSALLAVPACLALAAFVYGAAFIGQGLGAEQMYTLRSFVDDAIDAAREQLAVGARA
jgi:hypothetical protein